MQYLTWKKKESTLATFIKVAFLYTSCYRGVIPPTYYNPLRSIVTYSFYEISHIRLGGPLVFFHSSPMSAE